jgi:hypothetical protein
MEGVIGYTPLLLRSIVLSELRKFGPYRAENTWLR